MIVQHLKPPYYAVIFSTIMTDYKEDYDKVSSEMLTLAKKQKGFLGVETARSEIGITVSYWDSLDAILSWKNNLDHIKARKMGREKWYAKYQLRITKVEREYGFVK